MFKALWTIKRSLFGMKTLLLLSCGDPPGMGPQTNFSSRSLCGETRPSMFRGRGSRGELKVKWAWRTVSFFNERVTRGVYHRLTDKKGLCSAKSFSKTTGRVTAAGRTSKKFVVTGNPQIISEVHTQKNEKIFFSSDVRLLKMPAVAAQLRPPVSDCEMPNGLFPPLGLNYTAALPKATRHGFSSSFTYHIWASPKQQPPEIFDLIIWHRCPSRKWRFNSN